MGWSAGSRSMPSSNLAVAPAIIHYLWELRPAAVPIRVVDIGPGWGKYAVLIREYVDAAATIDAVEAWGPYVSSHRLAALYDHVWELDATALAPLLAPSFVPDPTLPTALYAAANAIVDADCVLMVDVIEHMPKAAALALLGALPGHVVVCTPRDYFANPPDLPHTEAHVSHWTPDDFHQTGRMDRFDVGLHDSLGAILVRLGPRP